MKLNTHAFPYPVLTNENGDAADYRDSAFQCVLLFSPKIDDNSRFNINYAFDLSNEDVNRLIYNGYASFAIEIRCADTLKRELRFLDQKGEWEIDASELYGKVEFTPMIVMRKSGVQFSSGDLNDEFDGASFILNVGDIIAIDDIWTKYIEFNNLSFDTLVKVDTDEKLDPFDYRIEPSPSFIFIWMGKQMRHLWNEMKQSKDHKPALMMSIYKDVVFLAITDLIENEESECQQWARSLKNKINDSKLVLPEEYEFNTINSLAQQMIQDVGVKKLFKAIIED